jgi:succinate dehydrogenase/fumarate reductase-like Fe-S protein
MNNPITAVVFRYDPERDEKPYYDEYRVNAQEEMSVLILLNRIHNEIDPTLSFRSFCCGLQMCQSCLMNINDKKRLACLTLVKPGEKVTIDPASYPEGHVKDLVAKIVDGYSDRLEKDALSNFFHDLKGENG